MRTLLTAVFVGFLGLLGSGVSAQHLDADTHRSPRDRYECRRADVMLHKGQYATFRREGNTLVFTGVRYRKNHRNGDLGVYAAWQKGARWNAPGAHLVIITNSFRGSTVRVTCNKGWTPFFILYGPDLTQTGRTGTRAGDIGYGCDLVGAVITIEGGGVTCRVKIGELRNQFPAPRY